MDRRGDLVGFARLSGGFQCLAEEGIRFGSRVPVCAYFFRVIFLFCLFLFLWLREKRRQEGKEKRRSRLREEENEGITADHTLDYFRIWKAPVTEV